MDNYRSAGTDPKRISSTSRIEVLRIDPLLDVAIGDKTSDIEEIAFGREKGEQFDPLPPGETYVGTRQYQLDIDKFLPRLAPPLSQAARFKGPSLGQALSTYTPLKDTLGREIVDSNILYNPGFLAAPGLLPSTANITHGSHRKAGLSRSLSMMTTIRARTTGHSAYRHCAHLLSNNDCSS